MPRPAIERAQEGHVVLPTTVDVVPAAALPPGHSSNDGRIFIEDNGAGDRNIIIYAGGQRFRIDGGVAF